METTPIADPVSYQDILNATADASFLLDAILMMAPQVTHSDHCNALQTVARTAKEHLKRVEEMVEAKWKESKK